MLSFRIVNSILPIGSGALQIARTVILLPEWQQHKYSRFTEKGKAAQYHAVQASDFVVFYKR